MIIDLRGMKASHTDIWMMPFWGQMNVFLVFKLVLSTTLEGQDYPCYK